MINYDKFYQSLHFSQQWSSDLWGAVTFLPEKISSTQIKKKKKKTKSKEKTGVYDPRI